MDDIQTNRGVKTRMWLAAGDDENKEGEGYRVQNEAPRMEAMQGKSFLKENALKPRKLK